MRTDGLETRDIHGAIDSHHISATQARVSQEQVAGWDFSVEPDTGGGGLAVDMQ